MPNNEKLLASGKAATDALRPRLFVGVGESTLEALANANQQLKDAGYQDGYPLAMRLLPRTENWEDTDWRDTDWRDTDWRDTDWRDTDWRDTDSPKKYLKVAYVHAIGNL